MHEDYPQFQWTIGSEKSYRKQRKCVFRKYACLLCLLEVLALKFQSWFGGRNSDLHWLHWNNTWYYCNEDARWC